MEVRPLIVLSIILVSGLVVSAGCMSSAPTGSATIVSRPETPAGIPAVPVPAASAAATPPPGGTAAGTITVPAPLPSPAPRWIQKRSAEESADDPYIVVLAFTKGSFSSDLPDCGMKAAFPEAANDPEYGIRSSPAKLVAYSRARVLSSLKANANNFTPELQGDTSVSYYFDPNTLGGPACSGVVASPEWNFVRIDATFIPRNARPADYDIGISIRSHGKVVEQLRTNRTLVLDQPVIYELYVPVKTDEIDLFDSVELVFNKKA